MVDRCSQLLAAVQSELNRVGDKIEEFDESKIDGVNDIKSSPPSLETSANQTKQHMLTLEIEDFGVKSGTGEILDDIAIIQSFYGVDVSRIEATTRALHYMLKSKLLPFEWIFVEGQKSKSDACFQWLKNYGITYIFVKTTKEQNGIFLKTPLWNIGAQHCSASKLCFIDSDVIFESADWLQSANDALDTNDVISIGGTCAYESNYDDDMNSIGLEYRLHGKISSKPHSGFTIGMSRQTFDQINGFDACVILDDIWNWTRLLGQNALNILHKWLPMSLPKKHRNGYQITLGSTNEKCIHLFHGKIETRKYNALTDIVAHHADRWSDIIEYEKSNYNILPKWNMNTLIGQTIRNAVSYTLDADNGNDLNGLDIYFDSAKKIFGEPNSKQPLIICTYCIPSFDTCEKQIRDLYAKLIEKCKNEFTFVVFSDCMQSDEYEFDVIPLSEDFDIDIPWNECFRQDVKFPISSNILFIEPSNPIDDEFELLNCEENEFAVNENEDTCYFRYSDDKILLNNVDIAKYMHKLT